MFSPIKSVYISFRRILGSEQEMVRYQRNGFTLVEIAIVLTVLGLLITGVLKGQQLIISAKILKFISQVQSYDSAVTTFTSTYGQKPGDFDSARSRLPGCTAAANCYNGNGDGAIATDPDNAFHHPSGIITSEETQAWKHLVDAGLISGVSPTALTVAWGSTHPGSELGGGLQFAYGNPGGPDETGNPGSEMLGTSLRLQSICNQNGLAYYADINQSGGPAGSNPLTPGIAARIDRKMDDGKPNTGTVWGSENRAGVSPNCRGTYNETSTSKDCILWVKIGQD
jgi:prepilin-type N-terminal cleavage/methylation domain-containing protein